VSTRKKRWLIGLSAAVTIAILGIFVAGSMLARRFEPYIKQQAIAYLSQRFQSEVEVGSLRVNIPSVPFMKLFVTRGRGVIAEVVGENILLRHKGRRDVPPMFAMKRFRFEVDLGRIFDPTKKVALVHLDHMSLQIPPKGERPDLNPDGKDKKDAAPEAKSETSAPENPVLIERVIITDSELVILPRNKDRKPLEFALHRVVLDSVQLKKSLNYKGQITNPKPPGAIDATGTFGPWNTESPSDTPLTGDYTFSNADLSVFTAIAGILHSTGKFEGTLGSVQARGEADVPDFRLKKVGNPLGLHVQFEALVDGTNGDTILKPVRARLNNTGFVTSGAVLKHDGDTKKTIDLDVKMSNGEMLDLLRLAMKNKPFMAGRIDLAARIKVPPLNASVSEKLILDGTFRVKSGQFLQDVVQDKVDTLSRRGQGQPKNQSIDNVFSDMSGEFHMADQEIVFKSLKFQVPGSEVVLAGGYDMDKDDLDFKGELRLKARVSQTMTGWKRWALKPIDPIFAKNGAGTLLKIKVTGTSKEPQFGATR
jgi:hypothetical protein